MTFKFKILSIQILLVINSIFDASADRLNDENLVQLIKFSIKTAMLKEHIEELYKPVAHRASILNARSNGLTYRASQENDEEIHTLDYIRKVNIEILDQIESSVPPTYGSFDFSPCQMLDQFAGGNATKLIGLVEEELDKSENGNNKKDLKKIISDIKSDMNGEEFEKAIDEMEIVLFVERQTCRTK